MCVWKWRRSLTATVQKHKKWTIIRNDEWKLYCANWLKICMHSQFTVYKKHYHLYIPRTALISWISSIVTYSLTSKNRSELKGSLVSQKIIISNITQAVVILAQFGYTNNSLYLCICLSAHFCNTLPSDFKYTQRPPKNSTSYNCSYSVWLNLLLFCLLCDHCLMRIFYVAIMWECTMQVFLGSLASEPQHLSNQIEEGNSVNAL